MKNWIDIGSDVNWEDHGGTWAKKAKDGSWYVLRFENMCEAVGREWGDRDPYLAEIKRIDFSELSEEQLRSARSCIGAEDECSVEEQLYACHAYGHGAPVDSFYGRRADRVRAEARRAADRYAADAAGLAKRLARPVNAIGSTAAEYGRGDINAALNRGPFDPTKQLMRHMHGMERDPLSEKSRKGVLST